MSATLRPFFVTASSRMSLATPGCLLPGCLSSQRSLDLRAVCWTSVVELTDHSEPRRERITACSQHANWTEPQFANWISRSPAWTADNGRIGIDVLRTNRAPIVLVSLQRMSRLRISHDANARDQWTRRVTGSTCSGQFISVQFVYCEQTFKVFCCCCDCVEAYSNEKHIIVRLKCDIIPHCTNAVACTAEICGASEFNPWLSDV